MQAPFLKLITIKPSHYCEKARWCLDVLGLKYEEEGYAPGAHVSAVKSAVGSNETSTPVLVTGKNAVFSDSTDILKYLDGLAPVGGWKPYPTDEERRKRVEELEEYFDEELGPHSRRVIYYHLLQHPSLFLRTGTGKKKLPWLVLGLSHVLVPFLGYRMARGAMKINEEETERSVEHLRKVFDRVEDLLEGGKDYLVGDEFTAADLTFAALAAPVLLPEEYGSPIPGLDEFSESTRDLFVEFREHAAGKFALRLYEKHRRPDTV